jgi:hypothetical protein
MKNLILLFLICPILFSCNPEETDGNQTLSTDYWRFKVTINGSVHEAEGFGYTYNIATTELWQVQLGITDPSESTFISGDVGGLLIQFENPSIGMSEGLIYSGASAWITSELENLNALPVYSFSDGGEAEYLQTFPLQFNITDLGSAGDGNWSGGQSFKASTTANLWVSSDTGGICDIPLNINIEFESLRQ